MFMNHDLRYFVVVFCAGILLLCFVQEFYLHLSSLFGVIDFF